MTNETQKFDKEIRMLLQALLEDLGNDMKEEEAGWRFPTELNISESIQREPLLLKFVERNLQGKIRLKFKDYRTRRQLEKKYNVQMNQLDYFLNIKADTTKVDKAQEIVNQIVEDIQRYPENWTYITAIGWWRMLESSGMPALVDDVLNEGFSPEDWTIKAIGSSSHIALGVAQRVGEINEFSDAMNFLREAKIPNIDDIPLPRVIDQNDVQKVKKTLKWMDIEKVLTQSVIKMLGFLWFSFFVLDPANLLPQSNELFTKLYKTIWAALEKLLGKNQADLLNELESIIRKCETNRIRWAPDILSTPEVI